MKRCLLIFAVLILSVTSVFADVVKFAEADAQNGSKPMAVFVYAQWAEGYKGSLLQFQEAQKNLGNMYNYVELDISDKDAAAYNKKYLFFTNIPYVMLLRSNGKFSRLIDSGCISNKSCLIPKMKNFIN